MTIWKYTAPIADFFSLDMPEGAEVLTVQTQHGVPCIWALVNEAAPKVTRCFLWRGTGQDATAVGRYVGTIQVSGGSLVFHLFEESQ